MKYNVRTDVTHCVLVHRYQRVLEELSRWEASPAPIVAGESPLHLAVQDLERLCRYLANPRLNPRQPHMLHARTASKWLRFVWDSREPEKLARCDRLRQLLEAELAELVDEDPEARGRMDQMPESFWFARQSNDRLNRRTFFHLEGFPRAVWNCCAQPRPAVWSAHYFTGRMRVECESCQCRGPFTTWGQDDAVRRWNQYGKFFDKRKEPKNG